MCRNPVPTTTVTAISMSTDTRLLKLLQLCSVSLPVGGYSFSQGLEYAIEAGWVSNAEQVADWLHQQLHQGLAQTDLPALHLGLAALAAGETGAVSELNQLLLACRETKELRLTDTAMGEAMRRLLRTWQIPEPEAMQHCQPASFVLLFAVACAHWQIEPVAALQGFAWAWLENQVAAATKLVPLGQSQAQQLLLTLAPEILPAIGQAQTLRAAQIGNGMPALAIASSRHETQYSRLFRS